MIDSLKTMLTVVRNPHGFHVIKVLPRGCKWTSQYYIDNVIPEICALHIAGDRRKLVFHAENERSHVSTRAKQYMEEHGLRTAPHPPYSPDPAPRAFVLFSYGKIAFKGSEFQTVEGLLTGGFGMWNAIPTGILMSTFHERIKRSRYLLTMMENMSNRDYSSLKNLVQV
jgi:hypothetical protein